MTSFCVTIHHHHVTSPSRISLTLSRHPSLSSIALGKSSSLYPVSAQSCWNIVSSWLSCLWPSMWRCPHEYIAYEFIFSSRAVSRKSGLSNLYNLLDGWLMALWLLFCAVFPPWLDQYCSQHSRVIVFKLYFHTCN